jgi:hypothetical protein
MVTLNEPFSTYYKRPLTASESTRIRGSVPAPFARVFGVSLVINDPAVNEIVRVTMCAEGEREGGS